MRTISGYLLGLILITSSPLWAAPAGLEIPARGIEKSAVEARFGAPLAIEGPVGQPPITKWIYREFAVVFEYDHVVHAYKREPVVEQAPVQDTGAARQTGGDTLSIPQSQPQPSEPSAQPTQPAEPAPQPEQTAAPSPQPEQAAGTQQP
jgi:hypothetical protein